MFILFIFLAYSFESHHDFSNENDVIYQTYDVNNLVRKSLLNYQNSHRFRSEPIHLEFQTVYKNFASELFENLQENSSKCFRDFFYVIESLSGVSGTWAIKMIDSFGKPDSGFLEGSTNWVGEYTECTQVHAPLKHNWDNSTNPITGDFHGQYCSLKWSIEMVNFSLAVTSGACVPDSCSASKIQGEIANLLHPIVDNPMFNGSGVTVTCKKTERHLTASAIAVIALLSFFSFLVLLGSSVTAVKYFIESANASSRKSSLIVNIEPKDVMGDQLKQNADSDDELLLKHDKSHGKFYDDRKKCEAFFECFCLFRNGAKLLNTKGGEGELLCIHGIRFLSMSWVILGHTYLFCFANIRNILETVELVKGFAFQVVLQGFYSVDSFFVLSGFLLTYLCMREFSKNAEGISWPYFYIHRYIRLTPVYMVVLGFSATVYLYLGSGPFWIDNDVDPLCRDNWWWNLLYINNFLDQQCMGWAWYLANDMQFFIISPLFLITLWRWPKIGYSLVALFLCGCLVANFVITYEYDLVTGMANILNQPLAELLQTLEKFENFFTKMYIKPYTRIGPYLIGMLTGYILFARKRSDKPKHSWVFLSMGWTVASTTTLACVYGLYQSDPSLLARCFYNALNRTIFGVGLSWVIYVCLIDQGGFVNSILSFKMFIPLSRLTYSAYLIHPMIITGYFANMKAALQFSHPTMVLVFLGFMVVTYALALPVALVLESPIISLEKLIRSRFSKKKESSSQ